MKPQHADVKVRGDLGGVKTEMSIDQDALEHLMGVLTDLYGNPGRAVIREYSTNAWDSHVEAGVKRPVEVSLPNAMSPEFTVRDFGVGLSVDQITGMYSKYGASTKRDSDDFNGTLGLGAKSALTYTNQFTMISVKNGVKATVVVSRNENNVGVLEIVDTVATTEPNGVTISIPSRDFERMREDALDFFQYWPKGTVLVDGAEPERIDGHWLSDNMVLVENGDDLVVMGNVAYPLPGSGSFVIPGQSSYRHFGVVVFVNIGDVAFAPSRETLRDNARTKAKVAEIGQAIAPAIKKYFDGLLAKSQTPAEAIAALRSYESIVGRFNNPVWRGMPVVTVYEQAGWKYRPGRARYSTQRYDRISYSDVVNRVVVLDYPAHLDSVVGAHRAKMRKWCEDNGHSDEVIYITEATTAPGMPWTDGSVITVSWEDIKKIKVDPKPRMWGGKVRNEKYDVVTSAGSLSEASDFDHDKILYYGPTEVQHRASGWWNTDGYRFSSVALRSMFPDHHIACISKNRWEKFKRDWPTAKHVSEVAKVMVADLASNLTEDDLLRAALLNCGGLNQWTGLDPSAIMDPVLSEYLRVLKGPGKTLNKFIEDSNNFMHYFGLGTTSLKTPKIEAIWKNYPLFSPRYRKESTEYINMIYNLRSESE